MTETATKLRSAPAGQNAAAQCKAQREIGQALYDWADAVNNRTVDAVCALYTPDATLLGTFEPKVLTTPEGRKNYFTSFKARKNLHASIDESFINPLSEDTGEASGLYTFTFADDTAAPQTVKARFMFVFTRQPDGDWLIVAHHSSVAPIV